MSIATIINGDARRLPLADGSVHCVVTSPPYFGLRSYGIGSENGEIGLEATPDLFVAAMVRVFREVRRVLRDDGTCWLNLGDSYVGSSNSGGVEGVRSNGQGTGGSGRQHRIGGMPIKRGKPKDLIGIPWSVALALQADGWYLRSDIIWAKPNPMPESVTDRPTKSHEYVFLLAKQERYYWDQEAVKEKQTGDLRPRAAKEFPKSFEHGKGVKANASFHRAVQSHVDLGGRNIRSVWSIPTESFPGAHFATYPRALVERCVKAGTSERGCCPTCGAPWERETSTHYVDNPGHKWGGIGDSKRDPATRTDLPKESRLPVRTTLGWRPTCICFGHFEEITPEPGPDDTVWTEPRPYKVYVPHGPQPDPVPATVLDPFTGSGTTGVVATGLGRRFVGVDLSADYCRMAVRRISRPHASHRTPRKEESHPLFAGVAE